MVAALLALTTLFPPQATGDTVKALHRAQYLVWDYYDDPIPAPRSCTGSTLRECRHGDWTCDAGRNCGNERVRDRLIARLEELAPRAGASTWLFRHRVGFAVKAGDLERAREIARDCPATEWSCLALRGFVEHQVRPGAGLAHFDSAYAAAPTRVRCEWGDLHALVGSEQVEGQGRAGCWSELPPAERFWWMADPLWSQPGNERYAEHLSRHVMTLMHEDVLSLMDSVENNGMPTLEYLRMRVYDRYDRNIAEGFWNSWRTDVALPTTPSRCFPRTVAGCDTQQSARTFVNGGYGFAPDRDRLQSPLASTAEDWAVEWHDVRADSDMFRWDERMYTSERWYNLDHQTALFRRGEDLLVLSAAALPAGFDTLPDVRPYLAAGRLEDLSIEAGRARIGGDRVLRGSVRAPDGSYLVSIEVLAEGAVARSRHGAPTPALDAGFGLSDIALVPPSFAGSGTDVLAAMLPSARLARSGSTGIYAELYGVDDGETVEVRLSAERVNRSFLRRLAGGLGLASDVVAEVEFRETIEAGGGAPPSLSFALDLSTLDPGDNLLTLTVEREDGSEASAKRLVHVTG